ncbi:MAG: tyrosine-protein phosphatase [Candidatus Sericytochromatia bacterium]|nr:tyrosine-protein phosphatase [Candidatus Sericytochromatia bacterium]
MPMLSRATLVLAVTASMALSACGKPAVSIPAPAGLSRAATTPMAQAADAERRQEDEPGWRSTQGSREDLGHFFKVDDQLFRGQQPSDKGLSQLREMGVKHVVYLHFNRKQAAHEKAVVEGLGMKFTHLPMSWLLPPKQVQIETWLKVALDPAQGPVFVHCQHGRDRTGTMVAIYRIAHDGWKFDQAYAEMKEKGFRTFFLGLSYGVKQYAKAHGTPEAKFTEAELAFGR